MRVLYTFLIILLFGNFLSAQDTVPQLVTPANSETVSADESVLFTWLQPVESDSAQTYKIKIVEILGDESPEAAMIKNKAFFEKDSMPYLYFQYSDSDSSFVSGSYYAWRIEITGSENLKSETRGFYFGQRDACITWDLLSDESVTSTAGNITGQNEIIGSGPAPTMSVFDYNSNGQRLWVGNTGWVAGSLDVTRYIEFNTSPVTGSNFNVTNVSFNYGDNQIATDFFILNSQVFYSIDNWVTSTALSQSALVYLNTSMTTFSATNLNIAVTSGQTFSLRIYPYAVQNGIGMTPTFAIHNNVMICGTSTTSKRITSIELSNVSEKWDKSVLLTAKLQESGAAGDIAVSNRLLKFYVGNKYVDSDSTNSSGIASAAYYIPMPSDSVNYSITAFFESDSIFSSQISTSFLTVLKHTTNLSLEVISDSIGQSLMLKASLTDSDSIGSRISNREVEFFVNNKYVDSDSTNSSGVASISYSIPASSDSVNLSIKASFTGNAAYEKSEGTGTYNNKVVGIEKNQNELPTKFAMFQNYPNPFNPASTIRYDIPKNSFVKIIVYDILGREIKILLNEEKSPGSYEINFDAKDLASGIYFYAINAGEFSQSRKMILLK